MENLISVIVPVYNNERFIGKCVDSLLHQTYRNIELIIVDDGSEDSSGNICDKLMLQDKRVRVIHNPTNKGADLARQIGIENSCGAYITFVDSDDWVEENHLERLLEPMLHDIDIDIVCGTYKKTSGSGDIIKRFQKLDEECCVTRMEALTDMCTNLPRGGSLCMNLYRRNLFSEGWRHGLIIDEDFASNWTLYQRAKKIFYSNSDAYRYVENLSSISHSDKFMEWERSINWMMNAYGKLHGQEVELLKTSLGRLILRRYYGAMLRMLSLGEKYLEDVLRFYGNFRSELFRIFYECSSLYLKGYESILLGGYDIYLKMISDLKEWRNKRGKIYVYGAGNYANLTKKILDNNQIEVDGFIVSDDKKCPIENNMVCCLKDIGKRKEIALLLAMQISYIEEVSNDIDNNFGRIFMW